MQGGPGGSSLFGLLEIHGPIQSVFDENGNTKAVPNPYAWTKEANLIYIDNPVGKNLAIKALDWYYSNSYFFLISKILKDQ